MIYLYRGYTSDKTKKSPKRFTPPPPPPRALIFSHVYDARSYLRFVFLLHTKEGRTTQFAAKPPCSPYCSKQQRLQSYSCPRRYPNHSIPPPTPPPHLLPCLGDPPVHVFCRDRTPGPDAEDRSVNKPSPRMLLRDNLCSSVIRQVRSGACRRCGFCRWGTKR